MTDVAEKVPAPILGPPLPPEPEPEVASAEGADEAHEPAGDVEDEAEAVAVELEVEVIEGAAALEDAANTSPPVNRGGRPRGDHLSVWRREHGERGRKLVELHEQRDQLEVDARSEIRKKLRVAPTTSPLEWWRGRELREERQRLDDEIAALEESVQVLGELIGEGEAEAHEQSARTALGELRQAARLEGDALAVIGAAYSRMLSELWPHYAAAARRRFELSEHWRARFAGTFPDLVPEHTALRSSLDPGPADVWTLICMLHDAGCDPRNMGVRDRGGVQALGGRRAVRLVGDLLGPARERLNLPGSIRYGYSAERA
jgi:hypothetical protein